MTIGMPGGYGMMPTPVTRPAACCSGNSSTSPVCSAWNAARGVVSISGRLPKASACRASMRLLRMYSNISLLRSRRPMPLQRRIAVVVALEGQQHVDQRAPLALGYADAEQAQHHKVGDARRHNVVAVEKGPEDGRRDALRQQLAVGAHARHHDADLDRVEHAPAFFQACKAMPFSAWLQLPAGGIAGQLFGIGIGKINRLAGFTIADLRRVPRLEEPVAAAGEPAG